MTRVRKVKPDRYSDSHGLLPVDKLNPPAACPAFVIEGADGIGSGITTAWDGVMGGCDGFRAYTPGRDDE